MCNICLSNALCFVQSDTLEEIRQLERVYIGATTKYVNFQLQQLQNSESKNLWKQVQVYRY